MSALRDHGSSLDRRIAVVLAREACSGCGACTLLDQGLEMRETDEGYLRPTRRSSGDTPNGAAEDFAAICPGVAVTRITTESASTNDALGASHGVWKAWATDPAVRHAGSSGGVLTALSSWMVATGRAVRSTGAAEGPDPRRSVPVSITTRAEALAAAGSRYTPVAAAGNPDVLQPGSVVVGKPCEANAVTALSRRRGRSVDDSPIVLSFFCAGTPSAHATDTLLEQLGVARETPVDSLRYRGDGWPGDFAARAGSKAVQAPYDVSWGRVLGPTTQWRCKICPDGVGESADIVAADYWAIDDHGYPSFADGAGDSALIARTRRGLEIVLAAHSAGVLDLEPIEMDSLAAVQPLQRSRRATLAARMLGAWFAGRPPPRYSGFGLVQQSLAHPRVAIRAGRGAFRRVRRAARTRNG